MIFHVEQRMEQEQDAWRTRLAGAASLLLTAVLAYALLHPLLSVSLTIYRSELLGFLLPIGIAAIGFAQRDAPRARDLVQGLLARMGWWSNLKIFVIALLPRLAWVLVAGTQQTSDFAAYDEMAREILRGEYILRPDLQIGAPMLFALVYALFGYRTIFAQLLMAILGAGQATLTFACARRIWKNTTVAAIAGLIFAFWPSQILFTSLLSSDLPYSFLFLVGVYALAVWGHARAPYFAVIVGLALGMANWIRPTAPVLLAACTCSILLAPAKTCPERIAALGGVALGFSLVVAPIVYLNYRDYGLISPSVSQQSGVSLMAGTNFDSGGTWNKNDADLMAHIAQERGWVRREDFVKLDQEFRRIAINRILQNPLAFAKLALFRKPYNLWGKGNYINWAVEPSRFAGALGPLGILANLIHRIFLLVAVWALGALALRRDGMPSNSTPFIFMVLSTLASTAVHMIFEAQPRYHYAFVPLLAMLAGLGIARAALFFAMRRHSEPVS